MEEDYLIEGESEGAENRRPFLIAVGALLGIFILALACSAVILLTRGGNGNGDAEKQIAAIETENAIIAVTNAAVTQTVAAMETEAARPTDTPVAPPTNTPVPTNTPLPTNTPVIQKAEEETPTPDLSGTSSFESTAVEDTPTPIASLGGGAGDEEALPQTGIETWGAIVGAFLLVGILLAARRLRSS